MLAQVQLMELWHYFDGIFFKYKRIVHVDHSVKTILMFIELSTIYLQVGLAVDDIKGIQEAASLKKLALQVRLNHQVW